MVLQLLAAWVVLSVPAALAISALIAHGGRGQALAPAGAAVRAVGDDMTAVCAACGQSSPAASFSAASHRARGHRAGCSAHGAPLAVAAVRSAGRGR